VTNTFSIFTGISGLLLKRLTNDTTVVQNDAVLCVTWYHETIHLKENITTISEKLPECPCDLTSMSFDPWWKWRTADEKDRVCFYLFPASAFANFGKVCLTSFDCPAMVTYSYATPQNNVSFHAVGKDVSINSIWIVTTLNQYTNKTNKCGGTDIQLIKRSSTPANMHMCIPFRVLLHLKLKQKHYNRCCSLVRLSVFVGTNFECLVTFSFCKWSIAWHAEVKGLRPVVVFFYLLDPFEFVSVEISNGSSFIEAYLLFI